MRLKMKRFNSDLILFYKNISRRTNHVTSKASAMNKYYINLFSIPQLRSVELVEKVIDIIKSNDNTKRHNENYIKRLLLMYQIYMTRMLNSTKQILEKLVNINGHNLTVTVTLKLLNRLLYKDTNTSPIKVFTAFRDSGHIDTGKREIGEIDYTIEGNTNFAECLIRKTFIKNDIKKETKDYTNEHIEFDKYYNCVITVPIYVIAGSEEIYFGYLCCDVLNKSFMKKTVFTPNEANILSSVASNMAMALNAINISFTDIFDNDKPVDFNNLVYLDLIKKRPEQ